MRRVQRQSRKIIALAIPAAMLLCQAGAWADAQSDYDNVWGPKEARATTPSERAKLANDLIAAANKIIGGNKNKNRGDTIAGQRSNLESLSGERRDEVLLLCGKAYELGSKQPDGYAPAAKALGVIQEVDPAKRIDSLQKLRKMYETVYQLAPSKNLGIAKGFAEVNLQLGEEQWFQLQDSQSKGKTSPADEVATLKAVSANYAKGLDLIRSAMAAIRPYAKGNKANEDFLSSAAAVEKNLLEAQTVVAPALAASAETEKTLRNQAVMEARLKANPADAAAADRLVRLYLNELDDPASIAKAVKQASPDVQQVVSLLKKPVKQLTLPQLLMVAQWCDKSNDNPASQNRIGMNVRTRIYCEAYLAAAKIQDDDFRQTDLTLKRVSGDLAKAQLREDQVKELMASYVQALEPAVAVAPVDPPADNPPAKTPGDAATDRERFTGKTPDKPVPPPAPVVAVAPEPERPVARVKVETPPEPQHPEARHESNSSIFDFGQN